MNGASATMNVPNATPKMPKKGKSSKSLTESEKDTGKKSGSSKKNSAKQESSVIEGGDSVTISHSGDVDSDHSQSSQAVK